MTPAFELDAARARAYLLRSAGDQVADAVEQEYFRSADALDTVEAAEESLIEDYLAGRLTAGERVDFERHYLAVPRHRTRVEAIRRLAAASQTSAPATVPRRRFDLRPLAIAAALVLVAGGSIWLATIRAVSGDEIWQGPLAALSSRPPGVIAVTDVPAPRLKPDDYTITLFETAASGGETERAQYFLRVRTR